MEKVSLYIPCYNAQDTVRECLESVFGQTRAVDEIIVIDDGSTDSSIKIAKEYPVKVIRHEKNRGLAACRNSAFEFARNEIIASFDADCAAEPEWLEELMGCIIDDETAGAGGRLRERFSVTPADKWRTVHMAQSWGEEFIKNPPFLYGSNTVFKKKAIEAAGFYNERFRANYEDADISRRMYDKGFKLVYNPRARAEHMRRDTIHSVFKTFWSWQHHYSFRQGFYGRSSSRRLAAWFGNLVKHADILEYLLHQDTREGQFGLLFLDAACFMYCVYRELKQLPE